MDAVEFAVRMVDDDDFMLEIMKDMPDTAFGKKASQEDFAQGMAEAAAKRGWELDPAELSACYEKAIEGLGGWGAVKFLRRVKKVMDRAGKSKKELKARGVAV